MDNGNLYEYEYTVQVESEKQLIDFCWQQIRFVDKRFPLAYLTRVMYEPNFYALKIKLKSFIRSTLESSLSSISGHYFEAFIKLLAWIVDFVCTLHSQGLMLCAPLEFCLLVKQSP